MTGKVVRPALGEKSFSCPHCGAISHQTWYKTFTHPYKTDDRPFIPTAAHIDEIKSDRRIVAPFKVVEWLERKLSKKLFVNLETNGYSETELCNLSVSECYSCHAFAVWVADNLLYPQAIQVMVPNEDMPADVRADFVEAASILEQSPRGAAALLRLSLQKLTVHLGLKGKKLDEDIGALFKLGLDARVHQALDVVRVLGNEAVHPGRIDLRDDKATASKLFDIVNVIVDATISQPKHIDALYKSLPDGALNAIKRRDGTNQNESNDPAS